MTHPTRRTLLAGMAGLPALALAGCGMSGGDEPTNEGSGASTVSGSISFATLQLKPTFDEYINKVIADFKAKFPGTQVEWVDIPFEGAQDRITADASAGTLADVINLNTNFAFPLEKEGVFRALEEIEPELSSSYIPGAYDAFRVPGDSKHYGYPWYLTSEITMYNGTLFEKAGMDAATAPAKLDELYAAATTIAQKSKGAFYGMHPALKNRFMTDLIKLGVKPLNDDHSAWTFNNADAVAHLDRLTKAYQDGTFPKDSLTQDIAAEREGYQAGKIALFPSGPNFLKLIRENAPDVANATRVAPQITGPNGVPNVSVMGLLIPKASKNAATAAAFAKFMTNAENQLAFAKIVNILPSTPDALKDKYFTDDSDGSVESKARRISAAQMEKAQSLTPVEYDSRAQAALVGKAQLAMQGKLSAQDALDQAVAECNKLLKQ